MKVKVIVPWLSKLAAPKSAKKQIVAHVSRKNIGASAFGGLALQALPQTSHALEPSQDMSSLVMGSGAESRPKTVLV